MAAIAVDRGTITTDHFTLLRAFGKTPVVLKAGAQEREQLWEFACRSGGIAHVPHKEVYEAWERLISGNTSRSGIAMTEDVDANFTAVGITFDRKLVAAHTLKTDVILLRMLRIFRRQFRTNDDFLKRLQQLAAMAE